MDKRNYRKLVYAVVLATSAAAMPGISHAADAGAAAVQTTAGQGSATADAAKSTAAVTTASTADPAKDTTAAVAANAAAAKAPEKKVDETTAKWVKNRPAEESITNGMKKFEGKTIVDTVFDGTSKLTDATAKAAMTMHTGDMFTMSGMNKDREAIYATGYFYDLYPSIEEVPEGIVLTYHVLENPVLKSLTIKGNTVEKTDDLMKLVTVKNGEILNSKTLHENVQAIQEKYRADGYILAKITDLNIDRSGDLVIEVNEGTLEGYKVKGNTKTKDYVILREMRQKVGEPFNSKKARRSMQRVYNLGFFEDVNIKMNPGVNPNAVIMEVDVKEKRTGSFGIGAGYSSEDGLLGMLSVSDTNFRGTGDAVSISYEVSGDDTDAHGYTFSWRHPYIDKKETVGTFKLYNRTYETDDYDYNGNLIEEYMREYSGGEITLGRPASEYSTNYVTLRNRKDKYVSHESDESGWPRDSSIDYNTSSGYRFNFSTSDQDAWRKYNFGTTRSLGFDHVTDTRDNVYNPTTGRRIAISTELAGLGGDFDFQKISIEDQRYFKVGRSQVIALRGMAGFGHGHISEYNQFRVGGQSSIRGYREDQFRGTKMVLGTVEYRFPLISKVQGAIFTDWGSAWDITGPNGDPFHHPNGYKDDFELKGSVGIGIALNTPMGPLRLDYGRGSDGGRVHFRVGGSF